MFKPSTNNTSQFLDTSTMPSNLPTVQHSNGNIISLVSLTSAQKNSKTFPWNSNSGHPMHSPVLNSPVLETGANKQILRQSVVLNQTTNSPTRIGSTRSNSESIHVLLKKSSNQTIVIVSKPQNSQINSNLSQIINSPPITNTTNRKINNLLISQMKNNVINSSHSVPIVENYYKSPSGIDLLAAAAEAASQSNEIINQFEPQIVKTEPSPPNIPALVDREKKTDNINKEISVSSGDVTRCICEMDHDDGFMICCDRCL